MPYHHRFRLPLSTLACFLAFSAIALSGESRLMGFGTTRCIPNGRLVVSAYDGSLQSINADGEFEVIGHSAEARFFHQLLPINSQKGLILGGANMETGKSLKLEFLELKTLKNSE